MDNKTAGLAALAVLVVLGAAFYLLSGSYGYKSNILPPAQAASTSPLIFKLTDPPQVPNGTTALTISYSSVAAHVVQGAVSGWVEASGAGSLNMLSLLNVSQVIASANVSKNATINMVRFNITSANITISNVTYNVTVPSKQVTAHLVDYRMTNGTSSVLLSMTPVVATIYTANTTIFVLVPSLKAVALPASNATHGHEIGARSHLNETEHQHIEAAAANITLGNASISSSNSITSLSVTVTNNGNSSVMIKHIFLSGHVNATNSTSANNTTNMSVQERPSFSYRGASFENSSHGDNAGNTSNSTMHENASSHDNESLGENMSGNMTSEEHGNGANMSSSHENETNATHGESTHATEREAEDVRTTIEHFRTLNFLVTPNGTLVLPFDTHEFEGEGYNLSAGASHTFMFSGKVSLGNGRILVALARGSNYTITVVGEQSARASFNLTAG